MKVDWQTRGPQLWKKYEWQAMVLFSSSSSSSSRGAEGNQEAHFLWAARLMNRLLIFAHTWVAICKMTDLPYVTLLIHFARF
jgi:hypothetical protein